MVFPLKIPFSFARSPKKEAWHAIMPKPQRTIIRAGDTQTLGLEPLTISVTVP